jgi:hypothetical protein
MKRFLFAAVVGLGLAAGAASAGDNCCGPKAATPVGGCGPACATPLTAADCCSCDSHGRFGWNPLLGRLFGRKKAADNCDACGKVRLRDRLHGPRCNDCGPGTPPPGIGYPGTPGAQMPGTLVFPNHPYMRSPRDFFMWEPKQ